MEFDPSMLHLSWDQIPTMGNLYTIVKELDDMLLENNVELEQCMSNIMECINDIPPIGKPMSNLSATSEIGSVGSGLAAGKESTKSASSQYESYEAAVNLLVSADVLEKNACFVPSQEDVTRVLQHILDAINRHSSTGSSGSSHSHSADYDQQIFLSLIKLSTHEGFCLPFKPQNSSSLSAQDPTVSALMDSEEKYNALLWQQICSKLETSFLTTLQTLPLANSSPIKNQLQKRHFLLEALCTLLPISHVWSKYCAIRLQDLHKLCLQVLHFQLGPRSKVNFTHLADEEQTTSGHRMATGSSGHDMYLINLNQFLKLLPSFFNKVKIMVEEDEFVVLSGIFGSKVTISEVYTQIYLPFIELLLSKMSEKVLSNLTSHQQQLQSFHQQTSDNILSLDEKRKRENKSSRLHGHGSKRKEELDQRSQQTQTQSAFSDLTSFMDTSSPNSDDAAQSTSLVTLLSMEELKQIGEVIKLAVLFEDHLTDRVMQLKLDTVTDKHEQSAKTVKSVLKNRNPDTVSPSSATMAGEGSGTGPDVDHPLGSTSSPRHDARSQFLGEPGSGHDFMPGQFPMSESLSVVTEADSSAKYTMQSQGSSSPNTGGQAHLTDNTFPAMDDHDIGRYLWIRVVLSYLEQPLSRSLRNHLSGYSHKCLEDLKATFDAKNCSKMASVCNDFNFCLTPCPQKIPHQVKTLLDMHNWCLPYLKTCLSVDAICAPILDSFLATLKALLGELNRQANLVPDSAQMDQMYLTFSAAWIVHVFSNHILTVIGEVPLPIKFRSTFTLMQKQYAEFCQILLQKMKTFHEIHVCAIMQDAESSNYSSMRANNSTNTAHVSSAVQAWFHFMKQQVIEESHKILPNDVACRLSSYILSQSLNKWLLRYSSVKPSFSRMQQMKIDIFAILQYTSGLLFACSNKLKNLLYDDSWVELNSEHGDIQSIHTTCNSLLAIVLVVTSPMDSLYSAVVMENYPLILPNNPPPMPNLQASFNQSQLSISAFGMDSYGSSCNGSTNEGYLIQWMKVVAPERFPFIKRPITPFDIERPESLVMICARLSVSSENVNAITLMTSLLLHDYMLPKLILREAPNFNVSATGQSSESQSKRLFAPYASVTCQGVHCVSDVCSLANAFPIIDLVRPFVTVLNHIGYICPNALTEALLPVMHEHGDFSNFLKGDPLKTTGWANVYLLLSPIVKELLQKSLLCLFETSNTSSSSSSTYASSTLYAVGGSLADQPFYESLGELPCGCRLRNSRSTSNNSYTPNTSPGASFLKAGSSPLTTSGITYSERVFEAVTEYMRLLSTAIYSLSPSLICFFSQLNMLCLESGLRVPNDSLLLYVLTRCTIHYIKNHNYMHDEVQIGALKKKEMKLLKKFKDNLKNLFCCHEKSQHWTADQASMYNASRPQVEALAAKLNRFVKAGNARGANGTSSAAAEKNFADDIPISVLEDQIHNGCQLLWSSAEGRISLVQVHHIIKANISWIETELNNSIQNNNLSSPSWNSQQSHNTSPAAQLSATPQPQQRFEIPATPVYGAMTANVINEQQCVNLSTNNSSGDTMLEKNAVNQLNWDNLFSLDLGLSKLALKRLIVNRPEFQDEESLLLASSTGQVLQTQTPATANVEESDQKQTSDSDLVDDDALNELGSQSTATGDDIDVDNNEQGNQLMNEERSIQQQKIMINEIRDTLNL